MSFLSYSLNFIPISEDSFRDAFNKWFIYKDNESINNELSLDEDNSRMFFIQNKSDIIKEEAKKEKNKNIKYKSIKAKKDEKSNDFLRKKMKRGRKKSPKKK